MKKGQTKEQNKELRIRGNPISRGIAIGQPFFFSFVEDDVPEFGIPLDEVEGEVTRYKLAIERSKEDVLRLKRQLEAEHIVQGATILDAHQQMMQDPLLTHEVEKQIRATQKNAEYVFQVVIKHFQKQFSAISDPFFRERFKDIQDISRRVMSYLLASVRFTLADIPQDSIIFARDFTPSDVAESSNARAGALVAISGGSTSHAAIVAKAKGIPYVANIDFDQLKLDRDSTVIVDGRTGELIINPTKETLIRYKHLCTQLRSHMVKLEQTGKLKPETYDGYGIRLSANIDMITEADTLHLYGSSGVGLFRSEYLILPKEAFPTEEEQFEVYKGVVEKMQGMPIVIRTFDIGGDKQMNDTKAIRESNPFLGCRAIRFLLKETEIFKAQLRAILRASAYGDVSIMFPMISSLNELLQAKALFQEAREELEKENKRMAASIRVGTMIEVPSAAIISDLLAKECDFLSIGTNDLVQYALAVDRDNHAMSSLYNPAHPSVIRLIRLIVSEANHQGIPVTVCGEVAADPRYTPLLLGLGVHELSVATRYIPIIKNAIRNTSIVEASRLAEQVMRLSTGNEIEALLNNEYKNNVPEDCFFNY